jgi:hypothetical protein
MMRDHDETEGNGNLRADGVENRAHDESVSYLATNSARCERCTGVSWEISTTSNLGELGQLAQRVPQRLREAESTAISTPESIR